MAGLLFAWATLGWAQYPSTPMLSKVGVFRMGFFWVLDVDGDGQFSAGDNSPDRAFAFGGIPGDIPLTGDWNGDGTSKVGIYRAANGLFILDYNGNGQVDLGDKVFWLPVPGGFQPGDIPVVGDWNGNGRSKVGFYRGGVWYLDWDGNGNIWSGGWGGAPSDVPVVGDWDHTGFTKIGVVRSGYVWILDGNGSAFSNGSVEPETWWFYFGGIPGDVPVTGDWNGDGRTKVGMFRYGYFWVLDNDGNRGWDSGDLSFAFGGIGGDVPVMGKWSPTVPVYPPTTPNGLSINGGGSTWTGATGVTVPFTFTYYDQVYGANAILLGQVELLDANQNAQCAFHWSPPSTLELYDGTPLYTTGFGVNLSDSYCTVSLVSIGYSQSDPSLVTVTVNFTFSQAAVGTYSVISQACDTQWACSPWGSVGSITVVPAPAITGISPGAGPANSVVTISGANLGTAQGSGTVRFGSTLAAGVQSWSGNAIHVLVPATLSVGTYQISVNVNGATAYAPSSFVLQPPPQTAMPAFSPAAGTYASAQSVTLSTTTSGAAIRYTTNGNSPTETMGTLYSGPIAAGSSMTIRAIAYKSGWTDSAVASAVYTIAAPQPDFTMTLTSSSPATLAGDTTRPASYTISVAGVNGFNQNATFAVSGYPTGSTATFGPGTVAGTGSTTLTIQVPQNADAHDYPLIISASAGTLTRIVQPVLSVRDYTITVSPPSQSVGCTGTVTYPVVQVTSVNGFAGTVGLTASELNGIYMASISAASVSIDGNNPTASATLTVNTVEPPNCTPEANTQIHLTGSTYSVATVTRTVMARIGINTGPSAISQVSIAPNPVPSGTAATVTVTLTSPAPAGGIPVGLTSSDTSAFPNASLTIPQGGSSGSIQLTAGRVNIARLVTLTATYGSNSAQGSLVVSPPTPYPLTTAVSPPGKGTVSPSSGAYGGSVTFTATPISGYQFTGFNANGIEYSTNPAIIPMTAATTVTATFAPASVTPPVLADGAPQPIVLTNSQPAPQPYQFSQSPALLDLCVTADPYVTATLGSVVGNSVTINFTALASATRGFVPVSCHWRVTDGQGVMIGEGGIGLPPIRVRRRSIVPDNEAPHPDPDPGGGGCGSSQFPTVPNNGQPVTWTYYTLNGNGSLNHDCHFSIDGVADNSVTIQGITASSQSTAAFNVTMTAAGAAPGPRTSLDCQYGTEGYIGWCGGTALMVVDGSPAITSISPTYAIAGATQDITITGSRLDAVTSVNISGHGCPGSGCALTAALTGVSSTSVTAHLSIAANAPSGDYYISVNAYGATSNSAAFTVYDAAPQITSVYPTSSPTPGLPFTVEINGTNFGAAQGAVRVCLLPADTGPCTPTGDFPTISIGGWSIGVVFVTLTSLSTASGHYCIQLASMGGNGTGFLAAPNGGTAATSTCSGNFTTTSYSISGYVTACARIPCQENDLRKPLPGVTVTTNSGNPVTTDETGHYWIPVDAGYTVTIGLHYSPYTLPFTPGSGTASSCSPSNPTPSNPTTCSFNSVQGNQTQDFATTFTTVFLLHGIGQNHGDMSTLALNLTQPTGALDLSRFVVDYGFDFTGCADVQNCASNCTINSTNGPGGGERLAQYIMNSVAPADIVLVGYSLGGLIARDMLVNNYSVNGHSVRGSHLIRGLITLGTPNEGYAYLPTDESLLCKYLLRDMKGYWNAVTNTYAQGSLSPFLSSLNQRWGPTSYGGYWFAAAGTNCASPFRVGPPPSLVLQDIGCLHGPSDSLGRYTVPNNDAVVCRDSAVDSANSSTPPAGAPTYTEYPNYVHTKAWGFGTFFVMGCTSFSSSTLELFNPPVDPQDPNHLLQKIVSQINGNQN